MMLLSFIKIDAAESGLGILECSLMAKRYTLTVDTRGSIPLIPKVFCALITEWYRYEIQNFSCVGSSPTQGNFSIFDLNSRAVCNRIVIMNYYNAQEFF